MWSRIKVRDYINRRHTRWHLNVPKNLYQWRHQKFGNVETLFQGSYVASQLSSTKRKIYSKVGLMERKEREILLEMRAFGLFLNRILCLMTPTTCSSTLHPLSSSGCFTFLSTTIGFFKGTFDPVSSWYPTVKVYTSWTTKASIQNIS